MYLGGQVCISVYTESIKHQKENVPDINWPTTLILGGTHSASPTWICVCVWGGGGHGPAPFTYTPLVKHPRIVIFLCFTHKFKIRHKMISAAF